MNILNLGFELIEQKLGKDTDDLIENMFKHIEICGRNCYKSEDKITDTSYEKFVKQLMDSDHGAMLEHGTVYLTIPIGTPVDDIQYMWKQDIVGFFYKNKYSKVVKKTVNKTVDVEIKGYGMKTQASATFYYITTNWRVIFENKEFELIKYMGSWKHTTEALKDSVLEWISKPTENHILRHTIAFTYHIADARDVNRHRPQSVAEESTRYCNYTKDKFSEGETSGLNIIPPLRLSVNDAQERYNWWNINNKILFDMCKDLAYGGSSEWSDIDWWIFGNVAAQESYFNLKNQFNWSNQECSLMLPMGVKTCSIHTAFDTDWIHFFNLRALSSTGAPRPSIKKLALELMELFIENKWIDPGQLNQKYYEKYLAEKNEV